MVMPSLLSRVVKSQEHDDEIMFIKDRVLSDIDDEG